MPTPAIKLPDIPEAERTPVVKVLLELVEDLLRTTQRQAERIQQLRDEIAVLKGEKPKPTFKASGMERKTSAESDGKGGTPPDGDSRKRAGSAKRSKTRHLKIHEEIQIPPTPLVPAGSRFKGYRDFVVQDLKIEPRNIRYRMEVWQTPEGEWLRGELPAHLQGRHFGPGLRTYVLYQHHHCQVTQPLLREQLREWGIEISVGQIDALLSGDHEAFLEEKKQVLAVGLQVSDSITVDDSSARHQGKNGYVTQIGNDLFAWFSSGFSKSRINFLELLQPERITYCLNDAARDYWQQQRLPKEPRQGLESSPVVEIIGTKDWEQHLNGLGIGQKRHRRIATEGALLGGFLKNQSSLDLAIVSDGAGQFALLNHGLCWVHAERLVHKLIPLNDPQRLDHERVRGEIWSLYRDLKAYKRAPNPALATEYEARFDALFTQQTSFETLNQTLKRLHKRKAELLLVLKRPDIPLHTNGSETDIRDFVKKSKISGGTRSDLGRTCRDTFASLKKTCRKLGLSFWDYVFDRIHHNEALLPLPDILRQRALAASPVP